MVEQHETGMAPLGEPWVRILLEIRARRQSRGESGTLTTSSGESPFTRNEPRPQKNPTPEERARPGFPWNNYETTDCPNCQGNGMVLLNNGVEGYLQEPIPCMVCSGHKAALSRERASGLPEIVKGFHHFNPALVENGEKALISVMAFAREEVSQHFLLLTGNNGVGKSHLLQAMAKEVLDNGFLVKYVYAPVFLDELRQTFNKHRDNEASFDQVFQQYRTPYLLVIDDLARGHYSDWGVDQMEKLIEHRYRNEMKTAFGTNYTDSGIAEKLGYMIADRVFDFGSGAALVAHMGGASYRTMREWE